MNLMVSRRSFCFGSDSRSLYPPLCVCAALLPAVGGGVLVLQEPCGLHSDGTVLQEQDGGGRPDLDRTPLGGIQQD